MPQRSPNSRQHSKKIISPASPELLSHKKLSFITRPGLLKNEASIFVSPELKKTIHVKKNTVAIITDGSYVEGYTDVDFKTTLPFVEERAQVLKSFARIQALPLFLNTKDNAAMADTIRSVIPLFSAVNIAHIDRKSTRLNSSH